MSKEITISLGRYDELIRAETLLLFRTLYENKEEFENNEKRVTTADEELINVIKKSIQYCDRIGDSFYNGNELAATIKGNRMYLRLVALEEYIEKFMNSRSLLLNLTGSVIEKNQTDGKTGHSVWVDGNACKMIKIKNEVIEELGLFDEVFKYNKVDRDKFTGR